jgi:hypothetical protein
MSIRRTTRSIGIVGRPRAGARGSPERAIGSRSAVPASSRSSAARSAGNSRTSIGSPRSNSVSTCPPDRRSITPPNHPICRTDTDVGLGRHSMLSRDYFRGK